MTIVIVEMVTASQENFPDNQTNVLMIARMWVAGMTCARRQKMR
jgi:hypothetical protein